MRRTLAGSLMAFACAAAAADPHAIVALDVSHPGNLADPFAAAAYLAVPKTIGPPPRLLFQPLNAPCTVFDTRYATDPAYAGIIGDGQTRTFDVRIGQGTGGPEDYSPQGGAYCNRAGLPSATPDAALLTVYVSDATANGWITLCRSDAPDASQATVSVYYTPGPTRTQMVFTALAPADLVHSPEIAVTSRYGTVNVSASLVGYYIRIPDEPPACFAGPTVSQALSTSGDSAFSINGSNGCPEGLTYTSLACGATGDTVNVHLSQVDVASGTCAGVHVGTGAATVTATPQCCRVAGEPY